MNRIQKLFKEKKENILRPKSAAKLQLKQETNYIQYIEKKKKSLYGQIYGTHSVS